MRRLVDADKLIKNIKSYTGVFNNSGYYTRNDLIVKAINKTPIAYDVDAVMREVGKVFEQYYGETEWYDYSLSKEVIDVIKRGGRNE